MNCMIAIFGFVLPRFIALGWWLTDAARWSAVFGPSTWLPILGFLFFPWTLLMVTAFWSTTGFSIIGWLFIFFAFMGDLATYGGGFLGNRDKVESYYR